MLPFQAVNAQRPSVDRHQGIAPRCNERGDDLISIHRLSVSCAPITGWSWNGPRIGAIAQGKSVVWIGLAGRYLTSIEERWPVCRFEKR
jgi:hypothetical protein